MLAPARYKGLHGGRGSGKSHFFAEQLVCRARTVPIRWACIREVQTSIRDSVRQLLIDKISKLKLGSFFRVLDNEIRGANGSLIIFRGMQSYNAETIKSLEGYDGAWIEEAQSFSDVSFRMLRPTIRKPGSEIWASWNPRHDEDPIDKFMRGGNRPNDAVVIEMNWKDNPWFPKVLEDEKDQDYRDDPGMAEHTWGGGYLILSEGSYYAKALLAAEREGRIGFFPYKPGQVVRTSWDIGIDDYMSCWFWVDDGLSSTVVDYYEAAGDGFDDFLAVCMPEIFVPPMMDQRFSSWTARAALDLLDRPNAFRYAEHFLPHDVRVREVGAGGRHRWQTLKTLGLERIAIGSPTDPEERVAASRRLLPLVRFHRSPRVELGLKRLRGYRRKRNDTLNTYTKPVHDVSSHAADAFGEYAVNAVIAPPKASPPPKKPDEMALEIDRAGNIVSNMNVIDLVRMRERMAGIRREGLKI